MGRQKMNLAVLPFGQPIEHCCSKWFWSMLTGSLDIPNRDWFPIQGWLVRSCLWLGPALRIRHKGQIWIRALRLQVQVQTMSPKPGASFLPCRCQEDLN